MNELKKLFALALEELDIATLLLEQAKTFVAEVEQLLKIQ